MCDSENEMQEFTIDEIPVRKNILGVIGLQEKGKHEESDEIQEEEMLKEGDYRVLRARMEGSCQGAPRESKGQCCLKRL